MGKSKKDLENEEEQSSATTHAIAMSIQKNEKFITLRDTGLLYYFNPEDGQYHEGETFLKEIIRKKPIQHSAPISCAKSQRWSKWTLTSIRISSKVQQSG